MPRKTGLQMVPDRRALLRGMGSAAAALPLASALGGPAFAAAPMLGIHRPYFYRFKLGAFEITNILDGFVVRPGPHPIFGQNTSEEAVQAFARENHLPPDQIENGYTVTLVNTGKELVLFDTGNGEPRRDANKGLLRRRLSEAGYAPDQVDVVVITHGHPDHIGGLMEDGKPAFPNARYVFGEKEFDYWKSGKDIPERRLKNRELFMRVAAPLAGKATFLKPGQDVVSGITAIEAFGHAPGMLAFNIESENRRLLLWADLTNHYVFSLMKPEWHVLFDHEKEQAVATRKRLLGQAAADGVPAIGYHMPFPAVGYVERSAESFRWVPVSYQLNL